MNTLPVRTIAWLKTYGRLKEDGWWVMPKSHAGSRFIKSIKWELDREDYVIKDDGTIDILFDWDGALDNVPADSLMTEMTIIGQLAGNTGWVRLKNLSMLDDIYIKLKLDDYQDMVTG